MERSLLDQGQGILQSSLHQKHVPFHLMPAIVHMLQQTAQSLDHLSYWTLRFPDQRWVILPGDPRFDSSTSLPQGMGWIPLLATRSNAEAVKRELNPHLPRNQGKIRLQKMDVLEILFIALGMGDNRVLIFFDTSGNRSHMKAIRPTDLHHDLKETLQHVDQASDPDRYGIA